MPLTFIHTSDWHLGRQCNRIGPKSAQSRHWRFEAVRSIYDLCIHRQASFLVVAGDVFQSDTPGRAIVNETVDLLRDAPVPVIVIPGNHDPLTEGSVWRRDDFAGRLASVPNVRLVLTCEPVQLAGGSVTIFPSPVCSKSCPEDLTAWIPSQQRGGDAYRIGLAHGILQGYDGREHFENYIAIDRAEKSGLDYLAMGDLHSYTLADHPAAKFRSFYSGTAECTAVDEERPGHALIVHFDRPGATPHVEPTRVGKLRPIRLDKYTCSPTDGFEPLRRAVAEIEQPEDALLGLMVDGSLTEEQMVAFEAWSSGLLERFLGVSLDRSQLYLEPSDADFAELGLDDAETRVLAALRQGGDGGALDDRASPVARTLALDPSVRREALSLYYRLLRNGGRA